MGNILCLGKGTQILAENKRLINIEDVEIGCKIVSYNFQLSVIENIIVDRVAVSTHSILNKIKLQNGIELILTPDHPIYVKNKGWCSVDFKSSFLRYNVKVKELELEDNCLIYAQDNITYSKVFSIDTIVSEEKMYNISGGDNHCFFAKNILVHDENLSLLEEKFD